MIVEEIISIPGQQPFCVYVVYKDGNMNKPNKTFNTLEEAYKYDSLIHSPIIKPGQLAENILNTTNDIEPDLVPVYDDVPVNWTTYTSQ